MTTEIVEVKKVNAWKAYDNADDKGKELLKNLFEEGTFSRKITDRVKTFEDACLLTGEKVTLNCSDTKDEIAYKKLKAIVKALNEGWIPNWKNNEPKHYIWFNMSSSGFSLDGVSYYYSSSNVPSRLCFKNEELARYAFAQFTQLFKDYMLID